MRITIRWRFLLAFSLMMIGCFVALHFTHRSQVRSQSGAYLRQADVARDAGDMEQELGYLQRYLVSRPDDNDQRERYAKLMVKLAKHPKQFQECFIVMEDVLRRDPGRDELRRYLVEFAITKAGLPDEAKGHLDILMAKYPNDGVLEDQYAAIKHYERDYKAASKWYADAHAHKPDLFNAYIGHSLMLREHLTDPKKADDVMAEMAEKNPNSFKAHLIRADYARKYDQPPLAKTELAEARKLGPDELDVIILGSEMTYAESRQLRRTANSKPASDAKLAEVRAELDRGRKLHPKSVAIHLSRAGLEVDERDHPAAIRVIQEGLAQLPENVELLLALVGSQIETQDRAGAEANLAILDKFEHPVNRVAYERARVLMLKEAWLEAARALDIVRVDAIDDAKLARSANLMLGRCYEQIGETDRRLDAFTRSIPLDIYDPLWVAGLLGQAEAYAALGRPEDALKTYQKLADQAPAAWVMVAKFRVLMQMRKSVEERIWSPVEVAIEEAVKLVPALGDTTEVQLLRADLLMFQKKDDECRKIVDELFAKRPKEFAVWVAKAARVYKDTGVAEALAVLEKGRIELADPVELRMAQAMYAADPKDTAAEAKLTKLSEGIEKYSPAARRRLLRSLAEAAGFAGNSVLAGRFWDGVVAVQPDDLAAQLTRFDRSLRANDESGLERVQVEIRRVDGEGGVSTKVTRALYLLWKSQKTKDAAGLPEALSLLEEIERVRPGWSRISLGKAVILDRQSKFDAALTAYQRAFEQGEINPVILRRLIELYAAKGQYAQANEILNRLPADDTAGPDAQRLAAEVSMRVDNSAQALKLAAKAVPADSKNPADWAWLGRLRWQAGDRQGAGIAFQQAVDLNPKSTESWLLLINYLATNNRASQPDFKDAKAKIERAKPQMPDEDRALFLAQSYVLVAQYDLAKEQFQKARADRPNDPRVLYSEADFLTATQQWALARDAWERLIPLSNATADDKAFAKRMFAICFAADPDYATSKRAVELLGMEFGGALKNPIDNETAEQRRIRALALAMQRDRGSKLAAIGLFEADRAALAPGDRFLLAKLYNHVGDRRNVRTTMSDLLINSEKDSLYIAFLTFYTAWLTDLKEYDDAATWLAKLEKREPDTLRTADLQIRILAGQKKLPAARAILQMQSAKPNASLGILAQIAQRAELMVEAEALWKQFVEANREKRPEAVLALAEFYGRTNRLKDALNICDQAWETCPPALVAQVSVGILAGFKPDGAKESIGRVTKKIEDAIRTKGLPEATVQPELAYLRNLAEDYPRSIAIFREQAAEKPNQTIPQKNARALALNNLAYLVGLHEHKHDEALAYIKTARGLVGDLPDLVDTEALILLDRGAKKDLDDARLLLEGLVASSPTATAYFHLAMLEKQQGRREEHKIAWQEAARLALKAQDLHPLESAHYETFARENK